MTNKFEQLIEYVINDEADKARDLFHNIVVEKSREIYESMMDDEEQCDESFGGDSSDDLIDDVETDEEGISEEDDAEFDDEAEEDGDDFTHDLEDEHDDFGGDDFGGEDDGDLEDRVVDLEDKLDELMAEFEDLMGSGEGDDDFGVDGGDELAVDDTEEFDDFGDDDFDSEEEMMEAVSLSAAPKPSNSEESFVNKKSINDDNSGAAGMASKPVRMTGTEAKGRPAPSAGELIGKVQNSVGGDKKLSPAPKAKNSQESGVNTKTPFPKG
jgi:hypothetical protein